MGKSYNHLALGLKSEKKIYFQLSLKKSSMKVLLRIFVRK